MTSRPTLQPTNFPIYLSAYAPVCLVVSYIQITIPITHTSKWPWMMGTGEPTLSVTVSSPLNSGCCPVPGEIAISGGTHVYPHVQTPTSIIVLVIHCYMYQFTHTHIYIYTYIYILFVNCIHFTSHSKESQALLPFRRSRFFQSLRRPSHWDHPVFRGSAMQCIITFCMTLYKGTDIGWPKLTNSSCT